MGGETDLYFFPWQNFGAENEERKWSRVSLKEWVFRGWSQSKHDYQPLNSVFTPFPIRPSAYSSRFKLPFSPIP